MPTYSVTSVEGCLDAPKRAKIASEITRIHSKTTGAPTYFAQVIFTEIAPDYYFVGGVPLKGHQVFVPPGAWKESKEVPSPRELGPGAAQPNWKCERFWTLRNQPDSR